MLLSSPFNIVWFDLAVLFEILRLRENIFAFVMIFVNFCVIIANKGIPKDEFCNLFDKTQNSTIVFAPPQGGRKEIG